MRADSALRHGTTDLPLQHVTVVSGMTDLSGPGVPHQISVICTASPHPPDLSQVQDEGT